MKKSWLTTGGDWDNAKRGTVYSRVVGMGSWFMLVQERTRLLQSYICSVDKSCVGGISNPFCSGSGNFPL